MLDLIVALTLIVSGIVGFARGAVRELISVLAFGLAILIAILALHFTLPVTYKVIHIVWGAAAAALLIVFIAAFIVLRVMGDAIIKSVRGTPVIGTIDRFIGLG